jgi:ribosome-associated protein
LNIENTNNKNNTGYAAALEIGGLLSEHKGGNVVVLDLRNFFIWTDFFVIATVTSSAHLGGLRRHINDWMNEKNMRLLNKKQKDRRDDEWDLIDLGNIVIHLMTEKARDFYELENLWSDGKVIKI